MAHNAKVSSLTDELVQSIIHFDPAANRQAYKHAKELAARGLRGHQYARTNPFEVDGSFKGLDEKFRVKNRDDLADALQLRLQRLQDVTSKFKPEWLALLLQLADRPLENTDMRALHLLHPPSPPPPLTWSEILHDDPYSDDEIWKDIDYGLNSSDDEKPLVAKQKRKPSPPTSVEDDDAQNVQSCLESADAQLVEHLEDAQFWNAQSAGKGTTTHISELHIIRETLHMLHGLRTHMYHIQKEQPRISIHPKYELGHAMASTVSHLLTDFTYIGQEILQLRDWALTFSTMPLIQAFQATVRQRLKQYDHSLSSIQERYMALETPRTASLLEVHDEVRSMSWHILRLAQILANVESSLSSNPFRHLEALFEEITSAQLTLRDDMFCYMSDVFFECLQPYLLPIRRWMEDGELEDSDQAFFVAINDTSSDASSLWHDRFMLRRDRQDNLCAPKFLQPAAKTIFDTGKSVVFLKELGIEHVLTSSTHVDDGLTLQHIIGTKKEVALSPFPEQLAQVFKNWIGTRYSKASEILRQHLFQNDHLMRIFDVFETVYLGKNGAVFENFANVIFQRMDARRRGWNDRYVLTELAQDTFKSALHVSDIERVVIRPQKAKSKSRSSRGLATISMDIALPWSIQNIIQRSTITVYQSVSILLLQTYRIKYLLQRTRCTHAPALSLRHRLIWFTDVFRSYLTESVICTTVEQLRTQILVATDIDEMAQIHDHCIKRLQARTLLTQDMQPIYNAVIETLDLGVIFADAHTQPPAVKPGKPQRRIEASDEEQDDADADTITTGDRSQADTISSTSQNFERLLPFLVAGLKNVGRAAAEPLYEQLAERLQWQGTKGEA